MKEWRIDGIFNADAEKVDVEIKSIGDEIKPSDVLQYAESNPDSELHKCFEWDDTVAAEKYRLTQARKVLTFIITVPDHPEEVAHREYYVVETSTGDTAYKETRSIYINNDERSDLLKRAIRELKAFEEKYKTLTELTAVFDVIDEL